MKTRKQPEKKFLYHQDLHIHTVFSTHDGAIVPQQTVELVAQVHHARSTGISDHFEYLLDDQFVIYEKTVRSYGFHLGTEVDGSFWVRMAAAMPFDYYIYHCHNTEEDYRGVDVLLATGKPVIIAHPPTLKTNLDKVPSECYIEINNRYVWQNDWRKEYSPYTGKFRFVMGSDAHQPNWLNLNIARYVAGELGVKENIIFKKN